MHVELLVCPMWSHSLHYCNSNSGFAVNVVQMLINQIVGISELELRF